jgi:hypothetical protein
VLIAAGVAAASSYLGGTSGAWLRAPAGATALAMGGAATASPAYGSGFWNPALPATFHDSRVSIGSGLLSLGRTEGFAAIETHRKRLGMAGMLIYRGDPFLNDLRNDQEYVLDNGAFLALAAKISLSYVIIPQVSAGASLGWFYQRMPAYFDGSSESMSYIGGIDLGVRFKPAERLSFGLVIRDLNTVLEWQFFGSGNGGYSAASTDTVVPVSITAGSQVETSLLGKPLVWTCDLRGYLSQVDRKNAVLCMGVEWRRWDQFCIRAGLMDIDVDADLVNAPRTWFDHLAPAITAGFGLDLSQVRSGLSLSYAMATCRIWAGVDQQIDVVFAW